MKPMFTAEAISSFAKAFVEQSIESQVMDLMYLGEQYVNACKINGNYQDRSGNLRSSIGCFVIKEGQIMYALAFGNSADGVSEGQQFAKELKPQFNKGVHLVVYAGMDYAVYVENMKSYSVLSSYLPSSDTFIKQLSELL